MSKKLTKEEIQREFRALINSCAEGYTGEWDTSTCDRQDGFEAMHHGLKKLAIHYGVNVSNVKECSEA